MKALYWMVGIIVVVGAAWVVVGMPTSTGLGGWGEADPSRNTQDATNDQSMNATDASSGETQEFTGTMQQLMARGGSWRCDVSVTTEGITSSGTTYAAQGMVRADFTSDVPQVGTIETHMIMRDNTAYTWSSMMNRGFKFPIQGGEVEPEVSAEMAAQVNQQYDYRCAAWPKDESKFALPSGITF